MKRTNLGEMVLLNAFLGALAVGVAAFYFAGSFVSTRVADEHVSKAELLGNHFYSQGRFEKLRDAAVACYKSQDELFVRMLRGSSRKAIEIGLLLGVLGILFLLNAYVFRRLQNSDGQTHPNV